MQQRTEAVSETNDCCDKDRNLCTKGMIFDAEGQWHTSFFFFIQHCTLSAAAFEPTTWDMTPEKIGYFVNKGNYLIM